MKLFKMIVQIDPIKSLITSFASALTGTVIVGTMNMLDVIGLILQWGAWIVAIIAGIITIYNSSRKCKDKNEKQN